MSVLKVLRAGVRRAGAVAAVPVLCVASVAALAQQGPAQAPAPASADEPSWAYGLAGQGNPPRPQIEPAKVFSLPGAARSFTYAEIQEHFGPADWYPGDHPAAPSIVAKGREPDAWSCAFCHYHHGQGRPEAASLAGLPKDYIVQQLNEFKNDLRKSATPRMYGSTQMVKVAKALTNEEIAEAAAYFSAIPWQPTVRVVEAAEVPKSRASFGMWVPLEGEQAGKEPLGNRILEVPEHPQGSEVVRDPRAGFVAYVPVGSIARGEKLVTTGADGKTLQCSLCHGPDLAGLALVPRITGRSPSYIVRQLYDLRQGSRHGAMSALMQPVVGKLTVEDMIDIAAYVSSLAQRPSAP
jgi:cytochrome c553